MLLSRSLFTEKNSPLNLSKRLPDYKPKKILFKKINDLKRTS